MNRPPRLNRVLGATSGPYAGNTRAVLACLLTLGFLGLFGFLAVEYLSFGRAEAQSLVEQGWGAILAAFGLVTGLYFGARNQETTAAAPDPRPTPPTLLDASGQPVKSA